MATTSARSAARPGEPAARVGEGPGSHRVTSERDRGYAAPMNLGAPELHIVLLVVLLLFGGTKLPKLARSLGTAQKEFKKGTQEGASADDEADTTDKKSS